MVPEIVVPKWGTVYVPSIITLLKAVGTPRSLFTQLFLFFILFFYICLDLCLVLHHTSQNHFWVGQTHFDHKLVMFGFQS